MNIIKRLAAKILKAEINAYAKQIAVLEDAISKQTKQMLGLQKIIENQKIDILELRKQAQKRPHFKRKRK
ncbi:hypothetical protein [Avibacterium paragallinarum]|uniref:hypothetical protein n=1 Tax=Avibacterium paragallinarum TaxID=728 RepID=UPI000614A55E|nr:hypothetical protein [Avibacterium paragallinarum]QIR12134.1 hypothetical protein HBL79_07770 [Avibacterium paragallinarum]QLD65263.1 hypothetical protein VY92_007870 [Avibacterium paragallinarum]